MSTPTSGTGQEPFVGFTVVGESFQYGGEGLQDGDVADVAALGWFGDEAACAGVGLAADRDDALIPVDVADLEA